MASTWAYQPLPFYICDVDIYDLAPSVLLGTVDKLALIGQSSGTLRRIYSMLGAAPLRDRVTKRLVMPSKTSEYEGDVTAKGYEKLYPAYPDGTHLFHDPFPSLLIQDEAHLLDESLGTFAGLFESALDAVLTSIAKPLYELVAYEPDGSTRRRAKVVAASATVSDPDRQLEHLYQRPVPAMQFPYPGQSLYESFYAGPTSPPEDELQRAALQNVEEWSRWSRVYVGFMTNGRAHTATTVNLFQALGNNKIPIYVVTQANEAIYARLNPELVYEWLRAVGVTDLPEWDPAGDLKLGAHILQSAAPFGKYFADLKPGPANTYRYVYTLLHTYAHTLMKAVAEFSGLDMGSLGEYLFPADLAFVVYRNGTTMDLGNLSALWRNYNTVFLEHLLESRTLMCGSGSLCDADGGACPSCIVIPETSCVAANRLLSRSALRGGLAPREDEGRQQGKRIVGYLDITTTKVSSVAAS